MMKTRISFVGATLLTVIATGSLGASLFQTALGAQEKANIKVPAFAFDAT